LITALFLLLGSLTVFLLMIVGVLRAFGFIADAFPPAFSQFERTNAVREERKDNGRSE
jgi:hypothetical protein